MPFDVLNHIGLLGIAGILSRMLCSLIEEFEKGRAPSCAFPIAFLPFSPLSIASPTSVIFPHLIPPFPVPFLACREGIAEHVGYIIF